MSKEKKESGELWFSPGSFKGTMVVLCITLGIVCATDNAVLIPACLLIAGLFLVVDFML